MEVTLQEGKGQNNIERMGFSEKLYVKLKRMGINDKSSFYRIKVQMLTKDEAQELCEKLIELLDRE